MSPPALSTAAYGPLLRRSLARAAFGAFALAGLILALALGPALLAGGHLAAFAARPPHAPDPAPILRASLAIRLHLATVCVALVATAVLFAGVKGSRAHRILGWTWAAAMLTAAASSLFIREPVGPNVHGVGFLHLFAVLTLVSVPRAVIAARRHDVARHAAVISGFVIGGLGVAGLAAFLPGRLLWRVVFG